jgi:hypothetical protein
MITRLTSTGLLVIGLLLSATASAQHATNPGTAETESRLGQCGFMEPDCAILDRLFPLDAPAGERDLAWRVVGRVVPSGGPNQVLWWALDLDARGKVTAEVTLTSHQFWQDVMSGEPAAELLKGALRTKAPLTSDACPSLVRLAKHLERLRSRLLSPPRLVMDKAVYDVKFISQTGTVSLQTTLPDEALVHWIAELMVVVRDHLARTQGTEGPAGGVR